MSIVMLLIWILIIGVVVGLVYYVVDALPVPEPLNKVIKIVAMVVGIVAIIMLLLQFVGAGPGMRLSEAEIHAIG